MFSPSSALEGYQIGALISTAIAACIFSILLTTLYNISPLHPLSSFPGPKIAAATSWYRTYHEIYLGGRMTVCLERLHAIYGPVVRFGPNDLHFSSPTAFATIYSNTSKVTKDPWLYKAFAQDDCSFGYIDHQQAISRRAVLNPFFSRRNITQLQHFITEKLDKLCEKLDMTIAQGKPVDLSSAYRCLTLDIIMSLCFAESLDTLDSQPEGFRHNVLRSVERTLPLVWVFKHFPLIRIIMMNLPAWVEERTGDGVVMLRNLLTKQVDKCLSDPDSLNGLGHKTIYHRLLYLDPAPDPKSTEPTPPIPSRKSLFEEATALVVAGSDTVGNALTIGSFYIMNNKQVYETLARELRENWRDEKVFPSYIELEQLPYLTAVIKETLRMGNGLVSPLSRVVPEKGLDVDGIHIPAGTVVASAQPFVHRNEDIFPDAYTFKPERWLGSQGEGLDKWLVPFSKGPRMCLGMNLAWCELYLGFATLFRRFEYELEEGSTAADLEYGEYMVPCYKGRIYATMKRRV